MGQTESAAASTVTARDTDLGFTLDEVGQISVNTPLSVCRLLSATKVKETVQSLTFGTVSGQYLILASTAIALLVSGTIAWTLGSVAIA
jgi:hypothetical protein